MARFFSPHGFWNQPIGPNARPDPSSDSYIELLAREPEPNMWINTDHFTIPVYEVDDSTPRREIEKLGMKQWDNRNGHGTSFETPVPIPDHAVPDPAQDSHIALVDSSAKKVWDMFYAHKHDNGRWDSLTGMTYALDGDGVFDPEDFDVKDGKSIHLYGPGRAAGVPIIAGLIMRNEIEAGRIEHKLALATRCNAYKRYVWPATWTDGFTEGGPPEGCVLQLDPALDLEPFGLSPGAHAVARALQEYGAVNVDAAGGTVVYAEGLYGHEGLSWEGLLAGNGLRGIGIHHYRVLEQGEIMAGGQYRAPKKRE